MFIDRLFFELSCKNTETRKHGNTETKTDSDEYSIVAFCNYNKTKLTVSLLLSREMCCKYFAKLRTNVF